MNRLFFTEEERNILRLALDVYVHFYGDHCPLTDSADERLAWVKHLRVAEDLREKVFP